MHAVVLTGHGGLDRLEYREMPVPRPGADEVLIEVHACGMNDTDVRVREGAYGTDEDPDAVASWRRGKPTLSFPRIQGTDIVGNIVVLGNAIDPARIGQRTLSPRLAPKTSPCAIAATGSDKSGKYSANTTST